MQLSPNETLKPGSYCLTKGIVVKRRLQSNGGSVVLNFWLPGEAVDVREKLEHEYAALTKVEVGGSVAISNVYAELERAGLLLYWRKLELKDRLVAILEYLAPRYGVPVEKGMQLVLTQTQLAELIGCTRETVNLILEETTACVR